MYFVACILGERDAKKLEAVQLPDKTVARNIIDMSTEIENQLIARLSLCNEFEFQMDESTDVAGLAVLLVFVRYPFNKSVEEELLMCAYLHENTTGEDVFECINDYMTKHNLSWQKCIDI